MSESTFKQQVIFLGVRDLERAHGFYAGALGLSLTLDQGSCRIYGSAENAFVGLCTGLVSDSSKSCILTLVTNDVVQAFERAVAAGAEVESSPAYNPSFNITHCFLRDPDHHRIEIQCFHAEEWPGSSPRGDG